MARTGKRRGKARPGLIRRTDRAACSWASLRLCLVDRPARRHRRRRRARGGHRLLCQPAPRPRRAAGPARRRLGDLARRAPARPSPGAASSSGVTTAEAVSPHLVHADHRHRGPPLLLALRRRPARAPRGRCSSTCGPARRCRAARRSPSRWPSSSGSTTRRTLERKIKEIPAALALEWKFSKNEILSIYLNRAYLGAGATGFEAASERYFGKSAAEVSPAEAAMLAGLLRAPSRFAPTGDLARAQARAATIVGLMQEQGYLTAAAGRRGARAAGGALGGRRGARRRRLRRLGDVLGPGLPDPHDHRGRRGADHLRPAHPARRRGGAGRGLRHQACKEGSERAGGGRRHVARRRGAGDDRRPRSRRRRGPVQPRHPGAAADRARSFKPFVYAAALQAGASPYDPVLDAPLTLYIPGSGEWSPQNYTRDVPRPDRPDRGAGAVDQHRDRAGLRGDRPRAGAARWRRTSA